jgi:hypothetical protein
LRLRLATPSGGVTERVYAVIGAEVKKKSRHPRAFSTAGTPDGAPRRQTAAGGRVNPETWIHGSSRQRATCFERGLASGKVGDCDTFETCLPEDG